ncbi:hypothetical protein Poly51_57880 [Rubripirellula tenax]|uniref:Treble clef zinc finger domain-containing protein n=1 Tax=Rubripirellula tenax TaxID=2528015 RepID=A0A5C6EC62_9BACT|nr:hypothetical protein Poly51_57880 [Rubripirellula tenax]
MKTLQQAGIHVPLLVSHDLELAKEWHPTLNEAHSLDQIPSNSSYRVWWRCSKDSRHEWQSQVRARVYEGHGCPYCSGRRVIAEDSIEMLYPDVASEFHPDKNGDLKPTELAPQSNKKVWWQCSVDSHHEWQATVAGRAIGSSGCPGCRRLQMSVASKSPDVAAEWHPTKNGDLVPEAVPNRSEKCVWWQCQKDAAHEWTAMVKTRTDGRKNCPHCQGHQRKKRKRSATKPATSRLRRGTTAVSESHPDLLKFWHATKNANFDPEQVSQGSELVVWWQCPDEPTHEWQSSVKNQVHRKHACPECAPQTSGRPSRVALEDSIATKRPELSAEWHPTKNGTIVPEHLGSGSGKKVWWQCRNDEEHVWSAYVWQRTKGSGCPYCSGLLADSKTCLANVEPEIAKSWHATKNAPETPFDVRRQSAKKFWWQCDVNPDHVWSESVQNRVNRRTCPQCNRIARDTLIQEALSDSVAGNVSYLETFEESVASLSKLVFIEISDEDSQQALYRLIHAGLIASMETYLSDSFINTVVPSKELRNSVMLTTPAFKEKKYSIAEIVDWDINAANNVKKYLLDVIYHNLFVVQKMFETVLRVQFPSEDDLRVLQKSIDKRHHIVHRNGRNKKGVTLSLEVADLNSTVKCVRQFVLGIDKQMRQPPWLN